MNGLREVEGVDVNKLEKFPFSGMKVLGGVHIGLGITCMFLGMVDIVMFVMIGESQVLTGELLEVQKTAKQLTIASTGVWCGLWFILCGVMAINISENKKTQIFCYKISFLVLSILCAALFGPVCLGINAFAALLREKIFTESLNWMVPLLTAFCALVEMAIAIASSAMGCCCSTLSEAKVRVFVPGGFPPSITGGYRPQREKSDASLDIFRVTKRGDPSNFSTTKRIEWPDTGLLKNNKKHTMNNV